MGWLFMSSLQGHATPKAYMDAAYTFNNAEGTSEVLASALVKMRTWYAACRQFNKKTGKMETFALVCLVSYNPKSRDGHVFGYKDMSENMGPCESECPARILDLLDPATHEYATAWRARCRETIARRARAKPKPGDTIVFSDPIHFTDETRGSRFVVLEHGCNLIFANPATGRRYRIAQWRDMAWSVVPTIDLSKAAA